MRYLFTILIAVLMSFVSEVTLAQSSTGQPDFSQQTNYLLWKRLHNDYIATKEKWESVKDDPNLNPFQKEVVGTEFGSAQEALSRLCGFEDFGLACLSIANANRGTFEGYINAEKACYRGEDDGCILAAIMLSEGEGRQKAPDLAEKILKNNCSPDRLKVCRAYAALLASDQGHPADLPKALDAYKSFCSQMDDLESCKSAVEFLNAGDPYPETYLKSRIEITKQICALDPSDTSNCESVGELNQILSMIDVGDCTASSTPSCADVAAKLEQFGPENPNFTFQIIQLQRYNCSVLIAQSCYYLINTDFTPDNMKSYERGVAETLDSVCLGPRSLGEMREPFVAEACRWSANLGFAKGTERGLREARPYVENICSVYHQTCDVWATYLLEGIGGPKDLRRGSDMMVKACSASNFDACIEVARMLAGGVFGEKNPDGAKALLNDLCQRGEEKACNLLPELSQTQ